MLKIHANWNVELFLQKYVSTYVGIIQTFGEKNRNIKLRA